MIPQRFIFVLLLVLLGLVRAETHRIEIEHGSPAPEAFGTTIFGLGENETSGIWPCNQWSNFDLDGFRGDFTNLRLEGGNAIILLYPFVDATEAPLVAAERQQQLEAMLELADRSGIKITLRLGYAWDNGFSNDAKKRQVGLLVEPELRKRWYQFCAATYTTASRHRSFAGAFICWEDFWAYLGAAEADLAGRQTWARYIGYPVDSVPARREPRMEEYYDRFNEVLTRDFFPTSQQHFPGLGMEVRLDFDAIFDGERFLKYYVHRQQFNAPNLRKVYLYWGPFMGALNQGDEITADTAVRLLITALERAQSLASPEAELILSQFNYRDNTPGFSHNSRLIPGQVGEFIRRSAPILRQYCTGVYTWSNHSYAHNAINNGTFSTGPSFWQFDRALAGLDDGQPCVSVYPGGRISQTIEPNTVTCAGLDTTDTVEFSFRAKAAVDTTCTVSLDGASHTIPLKGDRQWNRYTVTLKRPGSSSPRLDLSCLDGAVIDDVTLSNHTQRMGSDHPEYVRDVSYADLADAITDSPATLTGPVTLAGVLPDGWISSRATFAAPAREGKFMLVLDLTIPSSIPEQTVLVTLRDSSAPAVSRSLKPGSNRLVISGHSPRSAVRLTVAFTARQRPDPASPDLRELAAHLDMLGEKE